ncbi:MAG: NYN domain-containing protein [Candidatus Pacebacteria bacterium]|nr:NYN domain-containing protein [Candidatus Paceibacterota bacterium]MDD3728703.1 NYN domain-containing protein [Candidatus Paceibacterota bacterium]MDD4201439.1 NYN domain-containing protein [Candidatus Paceibacterota bacterium]MDD4466951.1 NYN domain-containing protein [Candidatus Paceibacterota bacterium]MDD4897692.1 NYN domain-containing protein [Candidatus Paceibacterota bacterium]
MACKAAIAIDVDNLLISSAMAGQKFKGYNLKSGFENMIAWVRTFSDILCVHLYISFAQCLRNDDLFHDLWEEYKNEFVFEIIYCPKRKEEGGKKDNVDQHLIDHTKRMVSLWTPETKYFCLGSGDLDYSSLLWKLKREHEKEIAFILGSKRSFSGAYRQMDLVGKHPISNEDLIHYFLPRDN